VLAAEQGDMDAMLSLGYCYEYGIGILKDTRKAFELYTKAAKKGLAVAQLVLGYCCEHGIGTFGSDGDRPGSIQLTEAIHWYKQAAEQQNAEAMCNLGVLYEAGESVKQDLARAINLYEKSAALGHDKAYLNLGLCYEQGIGVDQNFNTAITKYKEAIKLGNAEAEGCLGSLYEQGIGVEESNSLEKAAELYLSAAQKGDSIAQYKIGSFYIQGIGGVEQNYEQALQWYHKAARQENADAELALGMLYEQGYVVEKNIKLAIGYYRSADVHGNSEAKKLLEQLSPSMKFTFGTKKDSK